MNEFVVSTPTGRRVLIDMGHGLAAIRPAFQSDDIKLPQERVQLGNMHRSIKVAADGTWITIEHLYSIAAAFAKKRKGQVSAFEIGEILFYDALRPDVMACFKKLFASYDPTNKWWDSVAAAAVYDIQNSMIHPR